MIPEQKPFLYIQHFILGTLLLCPEKWEEITPFLSAKLFTGDDFLSSVYATMQKVAEAGRPVDLHTVYCADPALPHLRLVHLTMLVDSTVNLDQYCLLLNEFWAANALTALLKKHDDRMQKDFFQKAQMIAWRDNLTAIMKAVKARQDIFVILESAMIVAFDFCEDLARDIAEIINDLNYTAEIVKESRAAAVLEAIAALKKVAKVKTIPSHLIMPLREAIETSYQKL
jgi:replicative DNA helicase